MQNGDKTLVTALLISFVSHGLIFIPAGSLTAARSLNDSLALNVTYIALPAGEKKTADSYSTADKLPAKLFKEARLPETEAEEFRTVMAQAQEATAKTACLPASKIKTDIDISKSTASLDYQQLLKAKLKNYGAHPSSAGEGLVNLSFTLSSDGHLKMIKIVEDTSSEDHQLRFAAIECIKQASPFPPFPGNLRAREATFNVTISFMPE